ncbi:MAG TPA: hypothetical protein VM694_14465 [Polyangium sp.]|nr:hypothetical protein [Polyangium sp.]
MLAALLIVLPLVPLPFATRVLIDRGASSLGARLADALDRAFAWRHADEDDAPAHDPAALDLGLDLPHVPGLDVLQTPTEPPRETLDPARKSSSARTPALRGGIHVRAEVVARAVQSGVVPSGVPVPASGPRPAGIALQGVGGFGAGLRDGDVLTRIGGAPATSVGVVIGAVAGALRHNAKVITGEVWRGDQRLSVAVDVPPIRQQAPHARPKTRGPAKRTQGPNNPP